MWISILDVHRVDPSILQFNDHEELVVSKHGWVVVVALLGLSEVVPQIDQPGWVPRRKGRD